MTRLLDTNHAIAILNADPRLASRLEAAKAVGDTFALTTTVLGELYYGAQASERVAENLAKPEALSAQLALYDFDAAAASEFGKVKAELRRKGRPIPSADAQIAAVARLNGLVVLTDDIHLHSVAGLTVENWLRG
ncbi:MAG: type II toxin-antitoxin system VapC family toxin [Planctomycetes bacterium]|nr:type II toxin-antitoxin system VapC family toxin [Planctomycetota bacterium]MBM4081740.1 type II toxin-antitoxin system VapC family toxin [Planctomycetota bacterium]MBM4085235.1 type II toxin-antitoxin system VapC family toxin [Planctomycetota bacterium]